jgi:putative hydroxymethylpyrimidine transport system ATP-binding protein
MMPLHKTPAISIAHLKLAYANTPVFDDISLHLPNGKWVGLLGQSGVGKSTLLRLIAGLAMPEATFSGRITTETGLALHEQISFMAQTDLLLPWLTVRDNASLGAKLRGAASSDADDLLGQVGLGNCLDQYPHQLSGGMRQRVALVRTLLEKKPIVLMDEPFSALDTMTRYKLQELACQMLKDKTVLFITHDPMEALRLADDIYILQGKPARLRHAAQLHSATPRDISDPAIVCLHQDLLRQLCA